MPGVLGQPSATNPESFVTEGEQTVPRHFPCSSETPGNVPVPRWTVPCCPGEDKAQRKREGVGSEQIHPVLILRGVAFPPYQHSRAPVSTPVFFPGLSLPGMLGEDFWELQQLRVCSPCLRAILATANVKLERVLSPRAAFGAAPPPLRGETGQGSRGCLGELACAH